MIDPAASQRWMYRGLFVLVALTILFAKLLPLSTAPTSLPGPDLLMCFLFAWIQRRPEYVPLGLMVAVLLLADFLLMRPPGLLATLTFLGALFLANRRAGANEVPFPVEWLLVTATILAICLTGWVISKALVIEYPTLRGILVQAVMSILAYPLIVGFSRSVMNVRRAALTDADTGGTRR